MTPAFCSTQKQYIFKCLQFAELQWIQRITVPFVLTFTYSTEMRKLKVKKKDRFLYTSRIDEQMAFHKDSGKNIVKLLKWFEIFLLYLKLCEAPKSKPVFFLSSIGE